MAMRKDALQVSTRIMQEVINIAGQFAPHGRGTVGMVQVYPNSRNVVPGEVMAAQVAEMNDKKVKTVEGGTFTVKVSDGVVTLVDGSGNTVKVTKTDIVASNGVIHVIDAVLMPG